jgi:MoxR-like ATPase
MNGGQGRGAAETAQRLITNIATVMVGDDEAIRMVVMALLCRGHILIEGGPGMGKTTLGRSLASSISGSFKRIQCTSDLLPSDVTGAYVYDQREQDFRFRPGPIMANLVLVDEVNRSSPRTQSAFLEAMEERQVTVEGVTHLLPMPFLMIATRNPIHQTGTFPLPETELDRFMLRVRLDYPTSEDEVAMLGRQIPHPPILDLKPVVDIPMVQQAQEETRLIYVDPLVAEYAVTLVTATRQHPSVQMGASPRATLALVNLAQAHALLDGRDFTTPDDIKAMATAALGHRLLLVPDVHARDPEEVVIEEILSSVPVADGRATPFVVSAETDADDTEGGQGIT